MNFSTKSCWQRCVFIDRMETLSTFFTNNNSTVQMNSVLFPGEKKWRWGARSCDNVYHLFEDPTTDEHRLYCLSKKWMPSSTAFILSPLIQFNPIHADITFWMDLSWWWIQSVKHFHCSFVSSMCWPVRWMAGYSIQSNYVTIYHNCAFGDAMPKPLIVVHSCQQHAKISLFNKWNKKFRVFRWHHE